MSQGLSYKEKKKKKGENMSKEIISRKEASRRGLRFFYTGRLCKWDHDSYRYTGTAFGGLCVDCCSIMDEKGRIGETFETIMDNWDNTYNKIGVCKLPYLSGTPKMGYQVKGYTLIDEGWYEVCSKLLWVIGGNGYVECTLSKENMKRLNKGHLYRSRLPIKLHRFILGISSEVPLIGDHINGTKLDNTTINLRIASVEENARNSKIKINNKTGFIGVDLLADCPNKPYRVRLYREGRFVFNMHFSDAVCAAKAYDKFLRENYPSDFNSYNFPEDGEDKIRSV